MHAAAASDASYEASKPWTPQLPALCEHVDVAAESNADDDCCQ